MPSLYPYMRVRLSQWLLLCLVLLTFNSHFSAIGADGVSNTVVRFEIGYGTNSLGAFDVELFDQEKPETVRNFLLYVRSGAYSNTFFHRCVPRFVIQGGGFATTNLLSGNTFSSYTEVTNYSRLMNEYATGRQLSNTFGTIAMAKVGDDPNSATSQWFFNLGTNTNLDTQNGGFTVFGQIVANTNASNILAHFNSSSPSNGVANLRNLLGTSYAVFNELPVATNVTSRTPMYRELYSVHVSVVDETYTPGLTPPSIELVSPPPNSTFTNQAVTISGTAGDDTGVARVLYRLQGGQPQNALGTTNWQVSISPQPGLNPVTVESIDWDGNRSASAAVTFLYISQVPLNIEIRGSGTVVGASTKGQWLQVGSYQTLTAVPNKGYIFHSWSGAVTSSLATITFFVPTNATNISLTAKFIAEPLPRLAGNYRGLFLSSGTPAGANSGSITLKLETSGKFAGKILHRGGLYSYSGKFNSEGQAVIQGEVGGIHRTINLELQKTNNAGLILGSIAGTAEVRLERMALTVPSGNSVSIGRYTFALSPPLAAADQLTPGGYGYGTCSIDSLGKLAFSGRLGDGQLLSGSAPLTRLHRWPLYVELLNGRGVLLGWVAAGTNNLDGTLHWVKGFKAADVTYPAGFSNQVIFIGSRFQRPKLAERVVDWVHGLASINGHFQVGISNLFKLDLKNGLTPMYENPAGVGFTIDPATGLVSGRFIDPWTGTSRNLRGVVLKRTHTLVGQFMDRGTAGRFQLGKSPFLVTQTVENVTLPGVLSALSEGGYLQFQTNASFTFTEPVELRYDTTLDANGHDVVFSGGGTTRLFQILTNHIFTAKGVTFADGKCLGADGADSTPPQPGGEAKAAGIMNQGGLVALTNCVLTNFVVQGGRGGKDKAAATVAPGGRACGAAIFNRAGRVILSDCYLGQNFAVGGEGNADALTDLLSAQRGCAAGGAVFSEGGECQVESTTFVGNTVAGGPTRADSNIPMQAGDGLGGALGVAGGRLQISLSDFHDNGALGGNASTNTHTAGGAHGGAILIETNATATIDQSTINDNVVNGGSSFTGDEFGVARGGAVFNGGSLQLRKSTLEENSAGFGGAIISGGTLVVDASTMSSNVATTASGSALFCYGGSLASTNSTFAFNYATNSGGALMLLSNSALILNATIAHNVGGGIESSNSSSRLRNSILSSNAPQNVAGAIIDEGYNFSSDDSASLVAGGSTNSINPMLGLYSTNGGPTRTFALLPNSPARNIMPVNSSPFVDQRGTSRPQTTSDPGDIGAFEFSSADAPPSILAPPIGGTARYSSNFTFQVVATGASPLIYTWLREGIELAGATNSSLTVSNADTSANYNVVVSNRFGSVTSVVARLTVDERPFLTGEPSDVPVAPGGTVAFAVGASGPALNFTWFHNGSPIPGTNTRTLSLTNAAPGMQGGYRVVITNHAGSVTSKTANLTFNSQALAIHQQPANLLVAEGATAIFSVLAGGVDAAVYPISYAWLFGNVRIPDATNQQLAFLAGLTNQGQYRVIVTNAYLSITSAPATLTVLKPPQLFIRSDGTNAIITCQGTPNRLHHLQYVTSLSPTQTWTVLASNTPSSSGTSVWTRPLIQSENSFFRVALP
jgi:cyclophilin family peptidyl-prolyl cis-trans isomerase